MTVKPQYIRIYAGIMMRFAVIVNAVVILLWINTSGDVLAQNVMGAGIYNTTNSPVFLYSGAWVTSSAPEYFMGDVQRTTALNGSVSFYVFGDSVTIYGARATTGSNNVLLCVDSICSGVSYYAASVSFGVIAEINGLSYGTHEIELINQQSGFNIFFDAVLIEPFQIEPTIQFVVEITAVLPETTPEPTPQWQVGGQIVSGDDSQETVYEYRVTTGDQQIAGWLFGLIITNIILIALTAWNSWRSSG